MKSRLTLCTTAILAGTSFAAVSLTSSDTFTTDTEGWSVGGAAGAPPARDAAAGQDGLTAGTLVYSSSGAGGPDSRWKMWNTSSEWTGDYTTAGVTSIEMYLDNRTSMSSAANIRVAFDGAGGWFYSDAKVITDVTVGTDWTKLTFDIAASDLTFVSGTGTGVYNSTMSNVSRFEIFASSGTPTEGGGGVLKGDQIAATIHLDDIRAIPEPSSGLLLTMSAGLLIFRRKK